MSEIESSNIIARIEPIFRDIFDSYTGPVTAEISAHDVEQWDSLANIDLVVSVEKEFGVKFTTRDIAGLKSLGDLARLIVERTG